MEKTDILLTGIRSLDLFAPLPYGGDTLIFGGPGVGSIVVSLELAFRLSEFQEQKVIVLNNLFQEKVADQDFKDEFFSVFDQDKSKVEFKAIDTPMIDAEFNKFNFSDYKGLTLIVFSDYEPFLKQIAKTIDSLRSEVNLPITLIFVTKEILTVQHQNFVFLSRSLAYHAIYPTIDPRTSKGNLDNLNLSQEHQKLISKLRPLLSTFIEEYNLFIDVPYEESSKFEKLPSSTVPLQALQFLSQPFFVTEGYVDLKAKYSSLDDAILGFNKILNQEVINTPTFLFARLNNWEELLIKEKEFEQELKFKN